MGTDSVTQTFSGSYPYYCIVVRGGAWIQLDAIQFSNGSYSSSGGFTTSNVVDWDNARGSPDGRYAIVGIYQGERGSRYGGCLCAENTVNSTNIKSYIVPK